LLTSGRPTGTKAGSVTPLRGVNFSVDKGELVVVLGPSGEGKTTLLRVIAGLLRQDRATCT
jgi:carbohydrate ABC transporter ATP-binding protein, CUT1 family (TC 3.A.1.1.-)